jgi:hypothetical protein
MVALSDHLPGDPEGQDGFSSEGECGELAPGGASDVDGAPFGDDPGA